MKMIVAHIAGNLLFILYLFINITGIKKNKNNMGTISSISFWGGCIVYVIYWVMIVFDFKTSGFDTLSFSMLILSWAFENTAYCITKKKNDRNTIVISMK